MFDAAVAARDGGVALGFFGGNGVYWQVRFEPSARGQVGRVLVCYRDAGLDPVKGPTATVRWRDGGRSEQRLLGGMSVEQQPASAPPAPFVVTNSSHWVYQGTGLRDGDAVPGIVGYEADRRWSGEPAPPAVAGTYTRLSHSPFTTVRGASEHQESTVYQAPSGAWVFNAGSIKWSWGLYNDDQTFADGRIQRIVANVLERMVAGRASPAPAARPGPSATVNAWRAAPRAAARRRRRRRPDRAPVEPAGDAAPGCPGPHRRWPTFGQGGLWPC
jgi:hypothetical protein